MLFEVATLTLPDMDIKECKYWNTIQEENIINIFSKHTCRWEEKGAGGGGGRRRDNQKIVPLIIFFLSNPMKFFHIFLIVKKLNKQLIILNK